MDETSEDTLGNGNVERPLQLVCDLDIGAEEVATKLIARAEEFISAARMTKKVKAANQIKGVAMYEEDEN